LIVDEFLLRALLGGLGVALAAGPLGAFVVWRRMAYFGEALANAALLGAVLAVLLDVDMLVGVLACRCCSPACSPAWSTPAASRSTRCWASSRTGRWPWACSCWP
jgi:zinc transport system permease protein